MAVDTTFLCFCKYQLCVSFYQTFQPHDCSSPFQWKTANATTGQWKSLILWPSRSRRFWTSTTNQWSRRQLLAIERRIRFVFGLRCFGFGLIPTCIPWGHLYCTDFCKRAWGFQFFRWSFIFFILCKHFLCKLWIWLKFLLSPLLFFYFRLGFFGPLF